VYEKDVGGGDQYHAKRQVAFGAFAGRPVLKSVFQEASFVEERMLVGMDKL
jgi:hypothetical protein